MSRRIHSARGFTLIELMAVVIIVGVLAVLAILGFRRLVTTSHISEATSTCGAIRVAQNTYPTQPYVYANISGTLGWTASGSSTPTGNYYPATTTPGAFKTQWGADCAGSQCIGGDSWLDLQVNVDAPVMYGYSTVSGAAGATNVPTFPINGTMMTVVTPIAAWYAIAATGDPDGNGKFSNAITYSFASQIFIDNEGE